MADHGTTTRFKRGCDCEPCRVAWNDYQAYVRRQKAYGRWPEWGGRIDAEPVRRHVRALQAAGMGLQQVRRLSGIGEGTIFPLLYGDPAAGLGPTKRISPERAQALLAVQATMDTLAAGAVMDGTGTRRRLQALAANGWAAALIAERLNRPASAIRRTRSAATVLVASAREIRDLYESMWDEPPPELTSGQKSSVARVKKYALRLGWAPPMAWDDDTMDHPDAQPEGVGYVPGRGKLPPPDEIAWLVAGGDSLEVLADRYGGTVDGIKQRLWRAKEFAA
jgi:hypothetical protein